MTMKRQRKHHDQSFRVIKELLKETKQPITTYELPGIKSILHEVEHSLCGGGGGGGGGDGAAAAWMDTAPPQSMGSNMPV